MSYNRVIDLKYKPDDLICHIKPVDQLYCLAIFLLTPTFAPWISNDHNFVQKALTKLYSHMKILSSLHVHALCAVVDKLPTPQFLGNSRNIHEDVLQRKRNPPTW